MRALLLRSGMGRFVTSVVLASALAHPGSARAEDTAGAEHAKRARVAYDLRDWSVAIQEYRSAYEVEQRPEYLFGIAQAERQSGAFAAAVASFKSYKRLESVSPPQSAAADLLIAKCEAELAKATAETAAHHDAEAPAHASVAPDEPAKIPPPDVGGGATALSLDGATATPKAFYEDPLGDSLFVVGLGAAGAGTFLLLKGNADMRQAKTAATDGLAETAMSKAHGEQVAAAVALPLGGVLLAAAVYRWATASRREPAPTTGWVAGPTYVGYVGQF
jgi:hypothetical protein